MAIGMLVVPTCIESMNDSILGKMEPSATPNAIAANIHRVK